MARLSFGAIRDKAAIAGYGLSGIQLSGVYHRFLSDRDSYDYGYEWNLLAERSFGNHFLAGLKRADYHADSQCHESRPQLGHRPSISPVFGFTFSFPIKDCFEN